MVKFDKENLRTSPLLRRGSPPKDIPGVTSPKRPFFNNSPSKYSTSHVLNFAKVSLEGKHSQGAFRLRKCSTTVPRPNKGPLVGVTEEQKVLSSCSRSLNVTKKSSAGERIVDFLCFSHDVLLHRILLSFDGELEIKDQSFNSLRTVTSATGQFDLRQPLVLEAHKFYRIYLKSRFSRVAPNRGTSWQSHFGDMTMEWGHCAVLGGMDLLIST
ncbi:uncharacterized protein LOC143025639 [Oratosquilla oratoria]|uniref:uncharacterized protein LOC143025639 n=1 Tax=Oratosquilla oratoria TaxID=337810 RepID=UPI003F7694B8